MQVIIIILLRNKLGSTSISIIVLVLPAAVVDGIVDSDIEAECTLPIHAININEISQLCLVCRTR